MVATGAEDELQWLFKVMSCVLASLSVPVATKGCVPPAFAVTVAGVTASDTSVPVPTVNVVPWRLAMHQSAPPTQPTEFPVRQQDRIVWVLAHSTPLDLGDGSIIVSSLSRAISIRTGETGGLPVE